MSNQSTPCDARVLDALYASYTQVAKVLCAHITLENDLLFEGRSSEFLLDKKIIKQRNVLIENYQQASTQLVQKMLEQTDAAKSMRDEVMESIANVQHLMRMNQTLLSEEISHKEERIDAIMKRIDGLDKHLIPSVFYMDEHTDIRKAEDHTHGTH